MQIDQTLSRYFQNTLVTKSNDRIALQSVLRWAFESQNWFTLKAWSAIDEDLCDALVENNTHMPRRRRRRRPAIMEQPKSPRSLSMDDLNQITSQILEECRATTDLYGQTSRHNKDNISYLVETFSFTTLQEEIITVLFDAYENHALSDLCDCLDELRFSSEEILSTLLNQPEEEICAALHAEDNGLLLIGLVKNEQTHRGSHCPELSYGLNGKLHKAMKKRHNDRSDFLKCLVGKVEKDTLKWSDYDPIHKKRDLAASYLQHALSKGDDGVNLLIYGPPGTGKTEFGKTLAAQLKTSIYSVGEVAGEDSSSIGRQRLSCLSFAQNIVHKASGGLILFDEIEDLLQDPSPAFIKPRAVDSKIYLNRLLEQNKTPTIWIANSPKWFGQSMLRRMGMVVEIGLPDRKASRVFWSRQAKVHELNFPDNEIQSLADRYEIPHSVIDRTICSAVDLKLDFQGTMGVLKEIAKVVDYNRRAVSKDKTDSVGGFSTDLINTSVLVDDFVSRIVTAPSKQISFCFSGPPGTGKSEFVHYLAEKLDMEVLKKRTSDLLSMWVGGSEKNIADAFEQAADEEKFLLFDEADSLLRDRNLADKSWEVSQVNEMLTWMEDHPYPFACTTNLKDKLDRASMRRFLFKLDFEYLARHQIEGAYRHFFGGNTPDTILALETLTPADFALVAKKQAVLSTDSDPQFIADMLVHEVAAKEENPLRLKQVGFYLRNAVGEPPKAANDCEM